MTNLLCPQAPTAPHHAAAHAHGRRLQRCRWLLDVVLEESPDARLQILEGLARYRGDLVLLGVPLLDHDGVIRRSLLLGRQRQPPGTEPDADSYPRLAAVVAHDPVPARVRDGLGAVAGVGAGGEGAGPQPRVPQQDRARAARDLHLARERPVRIDLGLEVSVRRVVERSMRPADDGRATLMVMVSWLARRKA